VSKMCTNRRNAGFMATAPRRERTTRPSGDVNMCLFDMRENLFSEALQVLELPAGLALPTYNILLGMSLMAASAHEEFYWT